MSGKIGRAIKMKSFDGVPQEHSMGCAVACVAACCGISYSDALALFEVPQHAWTRGYYLDEVIQALAKSGRIYSYELFDPGKHESLLEVRGTLVFIGPCDRYPSGHYLMRSTDGWMNSWKNFPQMIPVVAGVEPILAGQVQYILFEKKLDATSRPSAYCGTLAFRIHVRA
jgi:hypothetical protein